MPKLFLPPADTGKRAVFWGLFFFGCVQAALSFYLVRRPDLHSPGFGLSLLTLRQRLAENPGAPVIILLGSSRTQNGLSPIYMSFSPEETRAKPVVFNFAFWGSGSVRELMTFRRLRAAGIKPDWLLVDTWPLQWPERYPFEERGITDLEEAFWTDLPVFCRYLPDKLERLRHAIIGNLLPLRTYRSRWLYYAGAGFLLPRKQCQSLAMEKPILPDGTGWAPNPKIETNAEACRRRLAQQLHTAASLLNPLHISPDSDGALRELLDECRASGIKTALFIMPEHSQCRRLYTPQTHARVRDYLTALSKEYSLPVFDLRDWSPDEHFVDFCHLAPWGVQAFSERFGREVLRPLLQGETIDSRLLVTADGGSEWETQEK